MPYSTVIDVNSCMVAVGDGTEEMQFEPGRALSPLQLEWHLAKYPIVVVISDGAQSVEYDLETFISKTYRLNNGSIRFGALKFQLCSLHIMIGWKLLLEDLASITETALD
jgi:hypothetical protein